MAKEKEVKEIKKKPTAKPAAKKVTPKKPTKVEKEQLVIIKEVETPKEIPQMKVIDNENLEEDVSTLYGGKTKKKETIKEIKEEQKSEKIKLSFSGTEIIIIVLITVFVTLLSSFMIFSPVSRSNFKLSSALQNFISEYNSIINNYFQEVDEEDLLSKAIRKIIDELGDPYSGVIDQNFQNSLETRLQGSFSGFGIEIISDENNNILIVGIIEDGPAERIGLKPGDIILSMDGVSVHGISTGDFVDRVRTKEDREVDLRIRRNDTNMNFIIKRDFVTLRSVTTRVIEQNNQKVGYMYINVFAANTDVQFKEELTKLENQGINSLIIDVRGNTGGHLSSVESILAELLDSKSIIYQVEERGRVTRVFSRGNRRRNIPIVVLGDGGSASGSEILISALVDSYGARFVGTSTFGKGTVQEVLTTSQDVQYRITTKKWLTPRGVWVHGQGIKPTHEVELNAQYFENPSDATDNQLQRALELLTR